MNHSEIDVHPRSFRRRLLAIVAALTIMNVLSWMSAIEAFRHHPLLLGSAVLAFGLGLRHAFDADHIAAIDNVTRRLVSGGSRPTAVGFFFSLGHSSVVVAATLGVALAASRFRHELASVQGYLGSLGTVISALFLLLLSLSNLFLAFRMVRSLHRRQRGGDGSTGPAGHGPLGRRLDLLLGLVTRSWLMFPVGFLFGLGFDTATEIALLAMAAANAVRGLPIWSILVFPALFGSGMALADSLEGLFMLGVYLWTTDRPRTRFYYNLAATMASVLAAAGIASAELANLAPNLRMFFPAAVEWAAFLERRSEWIGGGIVGLFAVLWAIGILAERVSEARTTPGAV